MLHHVRRAMPWAMEAIGLSARCCLYVVRWCGFGSYSKTSCRRQLKTPQNMIKLPQKSRRGQPQKAYRRQ